MLLQDSSAEVELEVGSAEPAGEGFGSKMAGVERKGERDNWQAAGGRGWRGEARRGGGLVVEQEEDAPRTGEPSLRLRLARRGAHKVSSALSRRACFCRLLMS